MYSGTGNIKQDTLMSLTAAMREAVKDLGADPVKINPLCPADLVIDHSV